MGSANGTQFRCKRGSGSTVYGRFGSFHAGADIPASAEQPKPDRSFADTLLAGDLGRRYSADALLQEAPVGRPAECQDAGDINRR
jgi:hypothetical protein